MLGVLLVIAGLLITWMEHVAGAAHGAPSWWSRLPFGRLPGDIRYRGRNVTVFAPLGTSLLLGVLLTLILLVLARLRR